MNTTQIKTHLHRLIDETNDEQLLTELVEQIEIKKEEADWWETLSGAQQNRVLESEAQYKSGKTVSNDAVMEKIRQWLQK